MTKYSLIEETDGYVTNTDPSNGSPKLLVAGSQNMLIDVNKKIKTRGGYTRLGAQKTDLYNIRNAWTWNTSLNIKIPQRFYNDTLEAYLGTIDGVKINAWTPLFTGWSTSKKLRSAFWWDTTEQLDLQIMVQGDNNLYEWGGGIAVVDSTTSNVIKMIGNTNSITSLKITSSLASLVVSYLSGVSSASIGGIYMKTNPSDGDTFKITINGTDITITFVNTIGTNPGNVLIDVSATATLSNLLGLLNNPATTNSKQVALSSPNQTLVGYLTSSSSNGIIKKGTTTFAQNRFYTNRDKVVKNLTNSNPYTYIVGSDTTVLMGISSVSGISSGDILIQQNISRTNLPASSVFTNDIVYVYQNQLVVGSYNSQNVFISKNTSYYDFSYSTPRQTGEGAVLNLSDSTRGINEVGGLLLIFSGLDNIFRVKPNQVAVGSTLTESFDIKKVFVGVNQGALNQETIVPIGNLLTYLTNEVALRIIKDPNNLTGLTPESYSNPIKPDFDNEVWIDKNNNPDAFGAWYKNILIFSAPQGSRMYMLNFVETTNGRISRFWNPPQVFPVGPLSLIDTGDGKGSQLYGHSNSVPESYLLFDGYSDGQYEGMSTEEKIAIDCRLFYAYDGYQNNAVLKTLDEYYVEGEGTENANEINFILNYDYNGVTQIINRTIDCSDESILEGYVEFNSLSQKSLGASNNGGLINTPSNARKFRVDFEIAKEDFFKIQAGFTSNAPDIYWAIIRHGSNASLSRRKATTIKK